MEKVTKYIMTKEEEELPLADKIMLGANLAYKRLLEKARINDETLVFSKDGKIVHIKARDIKD